MKEKNTGGRLCQEDLHVYTQFLKSYIPTTARERHNLLADAPQYDYGTGSMPAMVVGRCMRRVRACGAESIGAQEESKYEWVDGGGARWKGEGRFPA